MRSQRFTLLRVSDRTRIPRAGCLALLAFLLLLPVRSENSLPVVGILAEVQAPTFKRNFQPRLSDVEADAGAKLRSLCEQHFGFCRFEIVADAAKATNYARLLKLTVTGDKKGFGGYEIRLKLSGIRGRDEKPLQGLDWNLYEATNLEQPTQDPERLKRDIRKVLQQELEREPTRQSLQKNFFATIPISRELKLRDQIFIIPISRNQLPAGKGSVFATDFKTKSPAESTMANVSIEMEAAFGGSDEIECLLLEFRHPKINLLKGHWDPLVQTAHQHAVNGVFPVYVLRYERDMHVGLDDGLALTPQ